MSSETETGNIQQFGGYLVQSGLLKEAEWFHALDVHQKTHQNLTATLIGLGLIAESDLASAYADFFDLDLATETDWPLAPVDIPQINPTFLSAAQILPIRYDGDDIIAAIADPTDGYAVAALEFSTALSVKPVVASARDVDMGIDALYKDQDDLDELTDGLVLAEDIERLKELATDAPVVKFVDRLIDDALTRGASDIHLEPMRNKLAVRFRVDGVLTKISGPPADMIAPVISRIKIMSSLDISEQRLPQDGRMRVRTRGKEIDFRVASSPTAHGEAIVMRILDQGQVALDFDSLGFDDELKGPFRAAMREPNGIILVTGPTGSGKTTTLYTGLKELNTPEKKILTVEDPVEYVIAGLGQVQVDPSIGRTFASSLRSFLRQDPDIIMVGEIRDAETASIAVQAALTGHLVISTLHTNSAADAIARLIDMGVDDYLIASTVRCVIAQRLVRNLCNECRRESTAPTPAIGRESHQEGIGRHYEAVGCHSCGNSGYAGRTVIAEILPVTDSVRRAITTPNARNSLESIAVKAGMRTVTAHGLEKVREGRTSLAEVLRVTRERQQ